MYKVFNADDVLFAKNLLNHGVGCDWGTSVINLDKSSLIDEVSYTLQVGVSPGDVGLADTEHVKSGLVQFDEYSIVDLSKTEQLKSLTDLGVNLVDTTNSNNKSQLGFSRNVVIALGPSLTSKSDFIALLGSVLLDVLFSPLENLNTPVSLKSLLLNSLLKLQLLRNLMLLPPLQN